VLASALSMDKAMTKRVCRDAGLPVVDYVVVTRGALENGNFPLPFEFPVFVKPANLGSSVGISKARTRQQLSEALNTASQYDRKIVIERAISGREFECAVLDGDSPVASAPCEIIPSQDFYTYEDKYILDQARIDWPAKLTNDQTEHVKQLALACFDAVGCEGMARVDFLFENSTGKFFINEINTIPGFTSISMYPKMWEYSGIPYPRLLDRLIESALKRAQMRREIRYTR